MKGIFSFLYNLLLYLFLIPVLIYLKTGTAQRLGMVPSGIKKGLKGKRVIWIHAASVGEVRGASSLIKQLKVELSDYLLLLSTITPTGKREAERLVDYVIFCPLDIKWLVRHTLSIISPRLIVILETELWPNLLSEAKRFGCPIMIANGRLSSRNIKRYLWFKPLMKAALLNVDCLSMQSQDDAKRIISLGAPQERVTVSGSCKFDLQAIEEESTSQKELFSHLCLRSEDLIIVAGSTREGEEEILLEAFKLLQRDFPCLRLIIVPRHLRRVEEIERLIKTMGLTSRRKTSEISTWPSIVILDTMGELRAAYSLAKICFVGGSLVPIGGHNILEPASLGKIVLFGRFVDNCQEAAQLLLSKGGGIQVENAMDLVKTIKALLRDPLELKRRGQIAKEVVEAHQGASTRNLQIIKRLLSEQLDRSDKLRTPKEKVG